MTKTKTAKAWTHKGLTMTAAGWAAKLGKSRANVQNSFKKKGIAAAIADWELWDSMGITHELKAEAPRKKVLAMCRCRCPKCQQERREPSVFERQLDPPPKINRVYCKSCRQVVGNGSSMVPHGRFAA